MATIDPFLLLTLPTIYTDLVKDGSTEVTVTKSTATHYAELMRYCE